MQRLSRLPTLLSIPLLGASLTLAACSDDNASGDDVDIADSGGTGGGEGQSDDAGDELGEDTGGTGTSDTGTTGGGGTEGTDGTTGEDGWGDESDSGFEETGGEPETDTGEEPDTDTDTDTETTGGEECDEETDVVLYLSPDDSNSMSAPVQIRDHVLNEGSTNLSGLPVRTWEFMNYYGFDYDPAADGDLSLFSAMNPMADEDNRWQMQIAVSSEIMTPEERPPMNVTLVLDTSGSMAGHPFDMLKESCRAIASQLRLGDKVSMVEWDTQNEWTLAGYEVTGPDDALLLEKVEELEYGGGTDLNGGLLSGYELAQMTFDTGAINRIVLISDGGANAGQTDINLISDNAEYGGSDGIYLVGVGVDDASGYNDELMNDVTDAGKGASVFMPSEEEIWATFGDNFESVMAVAARNVQVELEMPPGFEIVKFSGEEFSGDPKEVEPQHLAPNDTMVFHQQVETCAPDLAMDDAEITVTASWEDPNTFESKEVTETWTIGELTDTDQALLLKGAAVLAYAEALAAYKQAYTNDQKAAALQPALDAIAPAQAAQPQDAELIEIGMVLSALSN